MGLSAVASAAKRMRVGQKIIGMAADATGIIRLTPDATGIIRLTPDATGIRGYDSIFRTV